MAHKGKFDIKSHKFKLIFIILIALIISLTIALTTYALREDVTGNEITNEKQLIKMGALISMGDDTNSKITKNALSAKLDRYLGSGKTTLVTDTDRNVLRITYLDTGREYEIEMETACLGTLKNVTFNANGGEVSPATKRIAYGIVYGELPVPTRAGYTFAGWWTDLNRGVEVTATSICEAKDDEILYAKWTPNTYTVTFNGNGGNVSYGSKTVTYTSTYGDFPNATRTGYTFAGWFTEASGGVQKTGTTTYDIIGDSTLYAHWTANQYTVTFNPNGGSVSPTSKTVVYDSAYGNLPTPTKSGHTFAGWYTAASGGTAVNSSTVYKTNGNTTIYAHWTANTYTVTFNGNGGSVNPSSKTVTYGSTYGNLATASRTGYAFNGWYTAASGGTQITSGSVYNTAGNVTLYAHWTANTYSISYNLNGGSYGYYHPTTGTVDSQFTVSNPTQSGWNFTGWTITGMDSSTHTYGSSTTTNQTIGSTTATTFKNLRVSSGTVYFTAHWSRTVSGSGTSSGNNRGAMDASQVDTGSSSSTITRIDWGYSFYHSHYGSGGLNFYLQGRNDGGGWVTLRQYAWWATGHNSGTDWGQINGYRYFRAWKDGDRVDSDNWDYEGGDITVYWSRTETK